MIGDLEKETHPWKGRSSRAMNRLNESRIHMEAEGQSVLTILSLSFADSTSSALQLETDLHQRSSSTSVVGACWWTAYKSSTG